MGFSECLKYMYTNGEIIVPASSPSSPLRGYGQQFHTATFATPETPLSDGIGDGFSWGDDMYTYSSSSGEESESASSVEQQPHGAQVHDAPLSGSTTAEDGSVVNGEDGSGVHDATGSRSRLSSSRRRNHGPNIRSRSSVGRVAYRWGITPADAAEIVNNYESAQSRTASR